MPFHNTYRLTWVSLNLDMQYLFSAAPAKRSRCALPWMRAISSLPPLLTLTVQWLSQPSCTHAATAPGKGINLIQLRKNFQNVHKVGNDFCISYLKT